MQHFTCNKCGSNNLGYSKYSKTVTPVQFDNEFYFDCTRAYTIVDNYLGVHYGFCCTDCGQLIEHCGENLKTEAELKHYLTTPTEQLREEQELHDACILERIMAKEMELDCEDREVNPY